MPKLVSQETIGGNGERVEKWTIKLKSANNFTARNRARAFARRLDPTISNLMSPEVVGSEDIDREQATFDQLFPNDFGREIFEVEFVVVR